MKAKRYKTSKLNGQVIGALAGFRYRELRSDRMNWLQQLSNSFTISTWKIRFPEEFPEAGI